jgi:hypothetical protein
MKYITMVDYYANCRGCDGSTSSRIYFFNDTKEILDFALNNISDHSLDNEFYSGNGEELPIKIRYELGHHSATGITAEVDGVKWRTIDNGFGKKVWTKHE